MVNFCFVFLLHSNSYIKIPNGLTVFLTCLCHDQIFKVNVVRLCFTFLTFVIPVCNQEFGAPQKLLSIKLKFVMPI